MCRKIRKLNQDFAFDGIVEVIVLGDKIFAGVVVDAGYDNGEVHVVVVEAEHNRLAKVV